MSFSAKLSGEMKCVIQRKVTWGNEIGHLAKS